MGSEQGTRVPLGDRKQTHPGLSPPKLGLLRKALKWRAGMAVKEALCENRLVKSKKKKKCRGYVAASLPNPLLVNVKAVSSFQSLMLMHKMGVIKIPGEKPSVCETRCSNCNTLMATSPVPYSYNPPKGTRPLPMLLPQPGGAGMSLPCAGACWHPTLLPGLGRDPGTGRTPQAWLGMLSPPLT